MMSERDDAMLETFVDAAGLRSLHDIVVEQLQASDTAAWRLDVATNAIDISQQADAFLPDTQTDTTLDVLFQAFAPEALDALEDAFGTCLMRGTGFDLSLPLAAGEQARIVAIPQFTEGRLVRIFGTLASVPTRRVVLAPPIEMPEPVEESIEDCAVETAEKTASTTEDAVPEAVPPVEMPAAADGVSDDETPAETPAPIVQPPVAPEPRIAEPSAPVPPKPTLTPMPAATFAQAPTLDEDALRESEARNRKRRLALRDDFNRALLDHDVIPHYQPIVSLDTGRIAGLEALARWQHPTRGLIGPGLFMHVLEDRAICLRLGEVMLSAVLNDIVRWQQESGTSIRVGLNVTAADLLVRGFTDNLVDELEERSIAPRCLMLEIAAAELSGASSQRLIAEIAKLRENGVGIALDDYGRNGTLGIADDLVACDIVKVDRRFTADLNGAEDQQARFRAIAATGDIRGSAVLAQGIETAAQVRAAAAVGCTLGQGFGLGKPVAAREVVALMFGEGASAADAPARRAVRSPGLLAVQ